MKLTKEQIKQIKELRTNGELIKNLAKQFKVTITTIRWHTNESFRRKFLDYQSKRLKNMSNEKWEKYLESKREYQRIYHKNKYQNDPIFRSKQLNRMKNGKKKI